MRRHTDPTYRLKYLIKSAIWKSLRSGNGKGRRKWESLVGFTVEELKAHLESKFELGMSWDNAGEWHIDHIMPVSRFNFESPDDMDFKLCWALDNLQPMWGWENMSKGNRV